MKSFYAIIFLALFAMAVVKASEIEEDNENDRNLKDAIKKLINKAIAKLAPVVKNCVQKELDVNKGLLRELIACAISGTRPAICIAQNVKLEPCF
jgi:hypothetical protein